MSAYSADVPTYDYNPAKAGQLLDEAGWKAGADGVRAKDGQKLSLVVRTHSEDPDQKQLIQVLQSEFQKVGIDATTNTVEFPAFFQDVQNGKYQVGVIGWLNLSDPDRATFRQFTLDGPANYGKYRNESVDKLLKDARTTLDQTKAKGIYADAVKQIVDDAPSIVVTLREEEYTWAARTLGASPTRIMLRHLLPNAIAPLVVLASLGMGNAIVAEAALSFLGLGIQPPEPSWGSMLNFGMQFLRDASFLSTTPGVAIFVTVLSFNLLGDGLRDALDPRLRA